jgi:amidohydrolase
MTERTMVGLVVALAACASPRPHDEAPPAVAAPASDLLGRARARLVRVEAELIALRHDLHAHPEVSGNERRTAGVVSARLRALGLPVREGMAGHGVVAVLRGGRPGPVVAYRADMDAVASSDPDPVAFRSRTPGVRHICGHDVHVAVGLGVAEALAEVRDQLPGTVVLIFQPAEESAQGAAAMIAAGALRDPVPEAIFAVHSAPLPVGSVGTVEGALLSGVLQVELAVTGDGDLEPAARAAAAAVASVTNVAPGEVPPRPVRPDPIVAGVIGAEPAADGRGLRLRALVRTLRPADRDRALAEIEAALAAAPLAGARVELLPHREVVPATVNDAGLVRRSLSPLRAALGSEHVLEINAPVPFFSEDFAFYLQTVRGAMYWLGVSNPEAGLVGMPHSPQFAADDRAIGVGALAMTAVLLDRLAAGGE